METPRMKSETLDILFVEDLPTDVEIAAHELTKSGLNIHSRRVETKEGLIQALLSSRPDMVISDYSMPSFDGMSALAAVKDFDPLLPFIMLTGSVNEDVAVACIKAGANDYVIKEHIARLPFAVREALENSELLRSATEQKQLLLESEERYHFIFTASQAIMLVIDPDTITIMDANDAAIDFYGWPRQELIGKSMSEINTIDPKMLSMRMRLALTHDKNQLQLTHIRADGTKAEVEIYAGPVSLGGRKVLFSVIHDVSDRVAAERERDALGVKLVHYALLSPTIIYSFRLQGSSIDWVWTSENVETILGYTQRETLKPGWWFDNIAAADRERTLGAIAGLPGRKRIAQEYRFMKKDRTMIWLRDEMRLVEGKSDGQEVVGSLTNISSSKSAEAEILLKSAALESSANAIIITDREGLIEWANAAFETLTGYSPAEAIGKNPREILNSNWQDPAEYERLWDTILSGRSWKGTLINTRKNGELYHEEMTITPVRGIDQRVEHFITIKTDITERIRSSELLRSSLAQREVLIREVHHRVKNNMQIISSLLNLSAEGLEDPRACEIIEAMHRRIEAMAFVHEQFYAADDVSDIDFSQYLHRLADSMIKEFSMISDVHTIKYDLEPLSISLELAIPVGLIVSELLSNSFKYIGKGAKAGSISVSPPEGLGGSAG